MAFKMKGYSPFNKKENTERQELKKKYPAKFKSNFRQDLKKPVQRNKVNPFENLKSPYKKKDHDEKKYPTEKYTGPKYIGGAVPFVGGGKSKLIADTFTKIAQNRAKTSAVIKKLLGDKGYKFKPSPKSKSRGNL